VPTRRDNLLEDNIFLGGQHQFPGGNLYIGKILHRPKFFGKNYPFGTYTPFGIKTPFGTYTPIGQQPPIGTPTGGPSQVGFTQPMVVKYLVVFHSLEWKVPLQIHLKSVELVEVKYLQANLFNHMLH
jgi:hypothetical protein